MKMERKYVMRRRVVAALVIGLLVGLFTYATHDTCYVGKGGNALGYGSCTKMIDKMLQEEGK